MASLTPGLLEKLMANKDVKVTGEHRSALLQVLEILPSLAGGADDPWKSRGFYLKVSDSRHSAYVSVQDEDMDLIYSDKIQLGQFVYVSQLDSGTPVLVVRGLKPVPKRRPCVGNPKDLVSSEVLNPRGNVNFGSGQNGVKKSKGEGLELRRLSLDSSRRIWDQTPTPKSPSSSSSGFGSNLKTLNQANSQKKVSPKKDSPSKPPMLSISPPLKSKNGVLSPKPVAKPVSKDIKPTACSNTPSCLVKVPFSTESWSEEKISWDKLPRAVQILGKDIMHRRNAASLAAVTALEEASAAHTVILCLQAFGELCGSYQNISSGPLIEQYLGLHQKMNRAAAVVNSLLSGSKSSLQSRRPTNKNAVSWVHAAIETNLSKFILFKKPDKDKEDTNACHYVILGSTKEESNPENQSPPKKLSPLNHGKLQDSSPKQPNSSLKNPLGTKKMVLNTDKYPNEAGSKEAASLAEKLLLYSREWFLKYMENSLSSGFRFCIGEASEIGCLLRQLKRVNQWLDDLTSGDNLRVENLRKKIYGFLLTHADSISK